MSFQVLLTLDSLLRLRTACAQTTKLDCLRFKQVTVRTPQNYTDQTSEAPQEVLDEPLLFNSQVGVARY